MSLRKKVNLILYRFRERGLEVFLLPGKDAEGVHFIKGELAQEAPEDGIELDPVQESAGVKEEALAFEGDWHEIPTLKTMLYEDAVQAKEKLKELEQGTFTSIKDALRTALPHQYAFLKELKDILRDRNSIRDL